MNYSSEYSDEFLHEFINHYGAENIPNPDQYPKRFEFLIKSYEFSRKMKQSRELSAK